MVAGPAAFAVALVLLPGWVYWRLEARARTSRTALAEFFEVVAAGAFATGVTVLVYVSIPGRIQGQRVGERLVDPAEVTDAYLRQNFTRTIWSVALVVTLACLVAAAAAWAQRTYRRHVDQDQTRYFPQTPIWVSVLGNTDRELTLDLRDGRRITGYLGGHSVDDDGSPTVYLTPPLVVQRPTLTQRRLPLRPPQPEPDDFPNHAVAVPGSEIVAVWRKYSNDTSA